MTDRKIAIGRYARATDTARTDYIGRVVAHTDVGACIEIPNFTADGMPRMWFSTWENLERSTAVACRQAARLR